MSYKISKILCSMIPDAIFAKIKCTKWCLCKKIQIKDYFILSAYFNNELFYQIKISYINMVYRHEYSLSRSSHWLLVLCVRYKNEKCDELTVLFKSFLLTYLSVTTMYLLFHKDLQTEYDASWGWVGGCGWVRVKEEVTPTPTHPQDTCFTVCWQILLKKTSCREIVSLEVTRISLRLSFYAFYDRC
jgi:hypothetical protein